MIEAVGLTKRYGAKTAVHNLSFQVRPGAVTGFLGPNGSGKSTTMRMILGLDQPTAGHVTIGGHPFRSLPNAPRQVGALLDAKAVHGGRSARNHLLSLAQLSGIPARRVDEVLGVVGLQEVARRRSNGFSLGMGQRLGIAAALLGDPQVLLFDEPVNGLDPEGILLGPQSDEAARRRGPDRLRVLAPDERDGADRRPPHRDRPRPAARGHAHHRLHLAQLRGLRAGAHPARRSPPSARS